MPAKKKVRPIGDDEAAELDKEIDELDGEVLWEDDPDEDALLDEDEDSDEDDAWGASDDSEEEEV